MTQFLFAAPVFTARSVARVLGHKLGRPLSYAEGDEDVDGCVDVTDYVHVQVGADYLAVCVRVDATTRITSTPSMNRNVTARPALSRK